MENHESDCNYAKECTKKQKNCNECLRVDLKGGRSEIVIESGRDRIDVLRFDKNEKLLDKGWVDGVCNNCGGYVYEFPYPDFFSDELSHSDFYVDDESILADYVNYCSNENCKNHKRHYVGDMESLDYYRHKG